MRFLFSIICCFILISGTMAKADDFSIGAIADCQFADQPDLGERLYRLSPGKLEKAISHLNDNDLDYVIHLGDFIDKGWESFDTLMPITDELKHPLYHVLGNHDFSVADDKKALVFEKLNMPTRYYSFVHKGWRFIITDGNDISFQGWAKGSTNYNEAKALHKNQYSDRETWNGALSDKQLSWIKSELELAKKVDEKVALYSHFPIFPANEHNLWNDNDVLSLVSSYAAVKLWLNGHNHAGHYGEYKGIHFLTLKGMVDTEQTSYSKIDFLDDKIIVHGFGRQQNMTLPLK
jgi:manganese-dependent ADP-ribose/CDP-alcohol diphosphatase